MALSNVMFDMRRFAKTKEFMEGQDPEKVGQAVDAYIKKNVSAAAVGGKRVQARVNETLETLRDSLAMGHIKTQNNAEQVAKISVLMQQVGEGQLEETRAATNTLKSTGDAIKNNLPSMDSIVAAVTTANPLVGFGIKMLRDTTKAIGNTRKQRKELIDKQLKAADDKLKSSREGGKADVQGAKETPGIFAQSEDDGYRERVYGRLTGIEDLTRDSQNKFELIGDRTDQMNHGLETIANILKGDSDKNESLNQKADFMKTENRREKSVEANKGVSESTQKSGGLNMIGFLGRGASAMLGGIGAVGASVFMGALGKIKTLFTSIIRGGAKLARVGLRVGSRAFPITGALLAMYDFGKGFINASEITGKEDNNFMDRVQAGVSSLMGSFVTLADDITNMVGIDVIDSENITQRIYHATEAMKEWVIDSVMGMVDTVKSYIPEINIEAMKERVVTGFNNVIDHIMDKISSVWESIVDFIPSKESIMDSLKDFRDDLLFWRDDQEQQEMDRQNRETFGNGRIDTSTMTSMQNVRGGMASGDMGETMKNTPQRGTNSQGSNVNVGKIDNSQSSSNTTVAGGGQTSRSDEPISRSTFNRASYMMP